jgi:hypothetical protein
VQAIHLSPPHVSCGRLWQSTSRFAPCISVHQNGRRLLARQCYKKVCVYWKYIWNNAGKYNLSNKLWQRLIFGEPERGCRLSTRSLMYNEMVKGRRQAGPGRLLGQATGNARRTPACSTRARGSSSSSPRPTTPEKSRKGSCGRLGVVEAHEIEGVRIRRRRLVMSPSARVTKLPNVAHARLPT